ncbi:DUF2213 domain-containing protein [Faecalibacillus faecis]|uniref:DUF2213 domain-containing protein n=1 Tax=Faecalibacillus faecis TaxID=1982628 RepID=UPI003863545A
MLKLSEKQTLTVNNKMELGEDISVEAKGKGRKFVSRFIEPGVAHYEEFGDVLITKETLDRFINTMVGCPVIIQHKDIDDENVDKERVGVISNVWFNEFDGWYYCDGIIWDKQAIDLIKNQEWSVSCTYDFDSDKLEKIHNGKKIDMEFTGGEFLHLALVPNPRYERANIIMNAKDKDDDVEWITVHGNHIPIKKGQSKDEAVKEFLEGKKAQDKQSDKDRIKIADLKSRENEVLKQFYEAKEGSSERERLQYELDALKDERFRLEDKQSEAKGEKETSSKKESKEEKSKSQKPNISDYKFKNYQNPDAFLQGHMKQCETIKDTFEYVLSETDKKFENVKKSYWGNTPPAKQFSIELSNINRHNAVRDIMDSWINRNKDYKPVIDDIKAYQQKLLSQLEGYNKWNGKEWVKEKQNKNAKNSKGDLIMSVLNELESFIKGVIKNADDEDKKEDVKNEDKRKLIDEVGGILKGKVDDEVIRTIMKKMEEVSYEPSEDDKADNEANEEEKEEKFKEEKKIANKCKNEEEEKKEKEDKVEDEDDEKDEDDEVDKEEVKNKCKNSMKDVKEIIMGGKSKIETDYISKADRFALGEQY